MSIHRTDCFNIMHLSDMERERLIDADWEESATKDGTGKYLAELNVYTRDRQGILLEITRVFTENKIDVKSMNIRTSKKGLVTVELGFIVNGKEEMGKIADKMRQIDGVEAIERASG